MRGYGGYGGYGGYAPWGNAAISERASGKLDEAKQLFRNHIALVDVSTGPRTDEIVPFHLVTHAQKQFRDYVKQWGAKTTFRSETKPGRKSKLSFASVTVNAAAKAAFLSDPANAGAIPTAVAAREQAEALAAEAADKAARKAARAAEKAAREAKRAAKAEARARKAAAREAAAAGGPSKKTKTGP